MQDSDTANQDVSTDDGLLQLLEGRGGRRRGRGGGDGGGGVGRVERGDGGKRNVRSGHEWRSVEDLSRAIREVGCICKPERIISASRAGRRREERTGVRLDVVSRLGCRVLIHDIPHPESEHEPIQQTVHNFEPSSSSTEDTCDPPDVPRLSLEGRILEHDVRDLEDPQRQCVFSVLSDRLEESREERRAYDLVLDRLGVREYDRHRSGVFSVEELEVLVVGALHHDCQYMTPARDVRDEQG